MGWLGSKKEIDYSKCNKTSYEHHSSSERMTRAEYWSLVGRAFVDCQERLNSGPVYFLGMGTLAVSLISFREGILSIRPDHGMDTMQKIKFSLRYAVAQVIPSFIWGTQPASVVAESLKINPSWFYSLTSNSLPPPSTIIALNRLCAIRGAIAGTIILSQVFAISDVISQSRESYSQRIAKGSEAPLDDPTREGVVIRLAGEVSIATGLALARDGRRHFFPIFESTEHPDVKQMVAWHAGAKTSLLGRAAASLPRVVPIYWQVENGRYSHASSWTGLQIPRNWLFATPNTDGRLLILEADATPGDHSAMSLKRDMKAADFDLNLYEVAQGFLQLENLVKDRKENDRSIRIILMDPEVIFRSGGGRQCTVREHATELGLADVIVDARFPIVFSIKKWLNSFYQGMDKKRMKFRGGKKVIILETPQEDWFASLKQELAPLGYHVMDRADAHKSFGSVDDIPLLIYENSTADTFHSARHYVQRSHMRPEQVCALCPRPWTQDDVIPGVTYICSSELHDQLLRWVRTKALAGETFDSIQDQLDNKLSAIVDDLQV